MYHGIRRLATIVFVPATSKDSSVKIAEAVSDSMGYPIGYYIYRVIVEVTCLIQ